MSKSNSGKNSNSKKNSDINNKSYNRNSTEQKSNKTENKKLDKELVSEKKSDTTQSGEKKQENEEARVKPTKAQRFFNVIDKFGDLFFLNIYFFITCIPIVTIGAAFTALYTVTNKMVKDDESPVKEAYFKAFKENLKQGTIIWIIDLIYLFLMYVQYSYVISNDSETARIIYVLLGFEFILAAFAIPLQFPMVARYENTTFNLMRNALVFSLANLGTWIKIFFIWSFPSMLYFLNPRILVYTWFLWALFLTAFFTYVSSMLLIRFYDKIEKPRE